MRADRLKAAMSSIVKAKKQPYSKAIRGHNITKLKSIEKES